MPECEREERRVNRIFLTLALFATLLLVAALVLGLNIGDPRSVAESTRSTLSYHLLTAVAALIFAALVHAVLLTYFMGTGRWIEETSRAYKLDPRWHNENRRLKNRTIPAMAACLVVLILNVPLGALAVDSGDWNLPGVGAISPTRTHFLFALVTIAVNIVVNAIEYREIKRNGELIAEIVAEVRRIRGE